MPNDRAKDVAQDIVQLLELAAIHPEGEVPLFEGDLESVASLYQVHPGVIEQARRALASPEARRLAAEICRRARQQDAHRASSKARMYLKGVVALIARAMCIPNGMELLTRAPIEVAAVQLGAHPFAVEKARARLRASSPSPASERAA